MRGFLLAVVSLAALTLACQRSSAAPPREVVPTLPAETPPPAVAPPAPVPVAAESTEDRRVAALADKLPSPCGQAHSLKKSAEAGCKRTPFAMGYIERLVKRYGASDEEVTQLYRLRYTPGAAATFDLKDTPYEGNPKAPVTIVEFFDYGCPHCRETMPILDELMLKHPRDIVLYYKHFPLGGHKDSIPAAKAAVAAFRQGRFRAMHKALFGSQANQSKEAIEQIAKDLKLDLTRFDKDWNDQATLEKVNADKAQGEAAQVPGTPALFINGRMFAAPVAVDEIEDWIAEEQAMNR
jgi:protein-disulfide isomerase